MKALLLGDVSPTDENVELFRSGDIASLFTDTLSLFERNDINMVNMECALTDEPSPIEKIGPAICAPTATAQVMKAVGVNYCGISNNHFFDHGVAGFRSGLAALEAAGITVTGFGENYEASRKNLVIEKAGERVVIIAVCEHEYSYALENRMGARPYDPYDTNDDIAEAKKNADRVVVIYHGGKEGCRYPSPRLLKACRSMIKHGADIVLCQHSHCIGCYEEYQGCHILYGQGNFHFISNNIDRSTWYTSLAVQYDTKTHEISFVPVRTLTHGIAIAKGEDADDIMREFEKRNNELKTGEWKQGWHEFCESVKELYCRNIARACQPQSTDFDNAVFGHYLDCEAHTDVWRELFPTWNQTNCLGEE